MKISSRRRPGQPLSRASARTYLVINQFATPGLGSLLGGRFVAALGQLSLAFAGFLLVVGWFVQLVVIFYHHFNELPPPRTYPWLGWAGGSLFVAAWLWAWFTSLSLLREASRDQPEVDLKLPPVL